MGINDVDMMQGTGSSLTTEPLKKIYDVRTRTRHQTESFNPFTLTFGYSQQQQDYRLHEETYTPTTAHQMDMTLSETCDLVGFQAKGSGNVSITAPTITLKSVQDVRQEETKTKGFSTSTNLSTGIYEALISIATQTTYQDKSTKDEVKEVSQPTVIDMDGSVTLKTETLTTVGSSVQGEKGTTIIAQNQTIQDLPTVHHHSEKTCIPVSMIRLASAGIQFKQSMQEFVQTLKPSTPSENFKSDLYMALDEEGVDPMVSVEILSDPEVQEVVEDVGKYVAKKESQYLKQQKQSPKKEKLEESVPTVNKTLTDLDPSKVVDIPVKTPLKTSKFVTEQSSEVVDLEGVTLLNRVTTLQEDLVKKYPHLVEQIKHVGRVLDEHIWVAEMAIDLYSAYTLTGPVIKGVRGLLAIRRGETPYKAPPEQLQAEDGKPKFLGSFSEDPELCGGIVKPKKVEQPLPVDIVDVQLGKDQPWTIRPGQEWKGMVYGKAHGKTPGHKFRSYREAIQMIRSGKYERVHVNQWLKTSTGVKTEKNFIPDVLGVKPSKETDIVEVESMTDQPKKLYARMEKAHDQLPPEMRGTRDVKKPTQSMPPDGKQ